MSNKERDKAELQTAKDEYRALVNDATLDATEKWNQIRQAIKQFRQDAAAVLNNGACGVVAHDRRAKLAAFACEYAYIYYQRQAREATNLGERDELERRLGDLARYLTGIKSVPRAAPQLNAKEAAARHDWMSRALGHYGVLRGPLKVYNDRIGRLAEEIQERNALLPFLFTATKAINDKQRAPREKTQALDEAVRGMTALEGIHRDFGLIAAETIQAGVSGSPLQRSRSSHVRLLRVWNQPVPSCRVEDLVSVILALALVAIYTKAVVPDVKPLYQQLLKSERLHKALIDTFVEGSETLDSAPLLKHFIDMAFVDGRRLTEKVRTLNAYPVDF